MINNLRYIIKNLDYEIVRDIELINQDTTLPFFKFPYLYSPLSVAKRIVITDE